MKAKSNTLTRRAAAERLHLHPDSLTRLIPDGAGSAVTLWGGNGKPMAFDAELLDRFALAYRCHTTGRHCFDCWLILEDARATAAHLLDKRHGHGGCEECTPVSGRLCQPCGRFAPPLENGL